MSTQKVRYGTIAHTEEDDFPVMKAVKGESKVTFILDTQAECVNVWYAESKTEGDFKLIMDDIISSIKYNWVQFIAPLDDEKKQVGNKLFEKMGLGEDKKFDIDGDESNISEVLDGFEHVTEHHKGKEIPMLVGFWEV